LCTFVFYRFELRRAKPFIDIVFLRRNRNVTLIYLQFILINIVFYSIMFGMPSYLQRVQMLDAQETGLVMLSVAGCGVFITPFIGRWIDKSGSKPALLLGASAFIAGSLLLILIRDNTGSALIFILLSVLGFSNGISNLGAQTALYNYVSKEETGIASGLFMTSRFIGTILSSSLLAALFGKNITSGHLHSMAWICAAISLVLLLLTLFLPGVRKNRDTAKS
jgi:MFS family permease